MATYTDPATIHDPSAGDDIPAAWGDQVNTNQQAMANKATACAYPSAAQSLTTSVEAAIALNSERWDNAAIHDTVTNNSRMTVPTGWAGVWTIEAWGEWAANVTGRRYLRLKVNGTTTVAIQQVNVTSAGFADITISKSWKLAVGDYVEVLAFQDSGGALNVTVELAMTWQSIG